MVEVAVILVIAVLALAIGHRLGRRTEPRIVGSVTVPMIEAAGQRVMIGKHDMTVTNMVVSVPNDERPRSVVIDFVDSAHWENLRRVR